MDDVVKLLDENLRYLSHKIVEDTLFIRVASEKLAVICPSCNTASTKVHSRCERTFHDLPIQGKKVVYMIHNRKMFCHNAQCDRKTFAEQFLFLPYKAKKSTRLEQEIMKIAQNVSSLVAEKILSRGIAKVGKSTICNLLKKTIEIDKAHVKRVCIDDFALKKGHTYGTIMINLDTHQVVDLIRSRDGEEVTSWLKTFPNLEIVSRDGSITYAHSIAEAHPKAIQISDRFHLLQNLTKYCT